MIRNHRITMSFWLLTVCLCAALTLRVQAVDSASPYRDRIRNYDEAYTVLYQAAAAGEKGANLSDFRLTKEEVLQLYSDLVGSAPELFYLDKKIQYFYGSQSFARTVTSVEFFYTMTTEERVSAKIAYEKELSEIVSQVDSSLSEAEKALWVHDYLVASFGYDSEMKNYSAYSLFRDRKGVCQAYALAYTAILRRLGMEAVMIASPSQGHAWNLVKVNGRWYHVDVASDDPNPDFLGQVLHENFLLSDAEIALTSTMHSAWESSLTCSSSYSPALWKGVRSRMVWLDGRWYFIDSAAGTLSSSRFDGGGRLDLYTFRDKWLVTEDASRYWVGVFSGLSECFGVLFLNTPYEILTYSPTQMRISVLFETEADERVYGSAVYRKTLEYRIAASPTDTLSVIQAMAVPENPDASQTKVLPFTDVERTDSFYSAVRFVYDRGLFQGVSANRFAPDATLTRAMFVTVLGRLSGVEEAWYPGSWYADVPEGQWYSPYVSWASENGIVNGVGDGRFNPMGEITRAQMFKMAAYFGELWGLGQAASSGAVYSYEDAASVPDWALNSVDYCAANGLLDEIPEGGLLRPGDTATRAEAAQIIARLARLMGL